MSTPAPSPLPASAASSAPPLSGRAWLLLGLIFLGSFAQFWLGTMPVRFANTDDVFFQEVANRNDPAAYMTGNALDQGRFYFATALFTPLLVQPYRIQSPALFSLLRAGVLFAQIAGAGWLLSRVTKSAAWGATFALFLTGTLHIPLSFFPVLSSLPLCCGFCALLIALHFHLTQLDRPPGWAGLLAGAFYLFSCLTNEIFVMFLPLFFALGWTRGHRPGWRANLAPLVAVTGFVVVYVVFARTYPSNYTGTQLSFDLAGVGSVLARQVIGVIPGFELLVQRPSSAAFEPWLRSGPAIAATLTQMPWTGLLLAIAAAAALYRLLTHLSHQGVPYLRMWPWAVVFAIMLNLPVALSEKYQIFLRQRTFPYMYAFYSFFFLALAGLSLVVSVLHLRGVRAHPSGFHALLALLLLALCVSAAASNHRALLILIEKYN